LHGSNDKRRIVLILDYDGTKYKGFQWQAHDPSIQGEVERAIESLTREKARVRGASRTDAGAHARGQVVDFLTHAPYTTETFVNALNWYLPPDIKVRGAYRVSPDFSSRRDAVGRTYRYTLLNARWPSALLRDFSHWVSSPLDIARMKEAASYLPGTHDFAALTSSLPLGRNAVRRVGRWDVWRDGELVFIEAEATGFLLHQIRRTNGILVDIGLGRLPVEIMKEIMDGTRKELSYCPSLPAKGLCLMSVNYQNFPPRVGGSYEAG
jgi:tRNA pseudouridine38-40 synthase